MRVEIEVGGVLVGGEFVLVCVFEEGGPEVSLYSGQHIATEDVLLVIHAYIIFRSP